MRMIKAILIVFILSFSFADADASEYFDLRRGSFVKIPDPKNEFSFLEKVTREVYIDGKWTPYDRMSGKGQSPDPKIFREIARGAYQTRINGVIQGSLGFKVPDFATYYKRVGL